MGSSISKRDDYTRPFWGSETKLPDWHTHDYWRVSLNNHRPGTPEYGTETVETNEGVFYRWQLLQIHP